MTCRCAGHRLVGMPSGKSCEPSAWRQTGSHRGQSPTAISCLPGPLAGQRAAQGSSPAPQAGLPVDGTLQALLLEPPSSRPGDCAGRARCPPPRSGHWWLTPQGWRSPSLTEPSSGCTQSSRRKEGPGCRGSGTLSGAAARLSAVTAQHLTRKRGVVQARARGARAWRLGPGHHRRTGDLSLRWEREGGPERQGESKAPTGT